MYKFGDKVLYMGEVYYFLMYEGIKWAMICKTEEVKGKRVACDYQDVEVSQLSLYEEE